MSRLPVAALAARAGFVADLRFAVLNGSAVAADRADPVTEAWVDGHSTGLAEARAEAAERTAADESVRNRLDLSFVRLEDEQAEQLRQKLYLTVEALCRSAIAPLAVDAKALASRIARASAMLARADDDRVLRLHPDDIPMVAGRLPETLEVLPDGTLERGSLRLECSTGGVEDGPAHWRRAISEVLEQC